MDLRPHTKRIILAILLPGLAAAIVWILATGKFDTGGKDKAGTPAAATQAVAIVNGVTVVMLDSATQIQSDIRTEPLLAANYQAETAAYGTVLDLQPLVDLHARYATALADADAAQAMAVAAQQEYQRSRVLYQDNQNVSLKTYQAAHAAYQSAQARSDIAALNTRNIQAAARLQFGATLARWALDAHSPELTRLLNRQEVLLRVALPLDDDMAAPAQIQISANQYRRQSAYLVSPSPQSDPVVQGSTFIYRAAVPTATGTNIAAYLPTPGQITRGILIPAAAIVWYGGQPWAYRQIDATHFGRYPVAQQSPMQGGFFVTQGFKPQQRVVVNGAQLLLSEELRPQAAPRPI
ncbi:MAG: metal transporter [Betaproteobacteria bacterium]|nr:metal transporter [Betaproteobacteria bacterium]